MFQTIRLLGFEKDEAIWLIPVFSPLIIFQWDAASIINIIERESSSLTTPDSMTPVKVTYNLSLLKELGSNFLIKISVYYTFSVSKFSLSSDYTFLAGCGSLLIIFELLY